MGLPNFDDAYYAQKAKEMIASGQLWVVTFNGEPDFANPPFPFWMMALAFKVFGASGYAAVFFTALFGIASVYFTYILCLRLFKDRWTAFFSAFVLLFPGMFVDSSRRAMVDITLAFCVTGAMYFFVLGLENSKRYLWFGLASALAIMTKSVLGGFPLAVAVIVLAASGRWRELFNGYFITAVVLALSLGFSWHLTNWFIFGQPFLDAHFGLLIFDRGFGQSAAFSDHFGYARDFLNNYWPWLPIALIGLFQFGKRGFLEKDIRFQFLFTWVWFVFLVMSSGKSQTLRYIFMIFPALAIVTAKTAADWMNEGMKEKCLPYMVGIVMGTALFVNATPFQAPVSLSPNSVDVRRLAAVIDLNAPPNQNLGNYRLSQFNPGNALLFYSNRFLDEPVADSLKLLSRMETQPQSTWLASTQEFKNLRRDHPGQFYLIHATRKYAYFTSMKNEKNVRYDFSEAGTPLIR